MTGPELKEARRKLGLSADGLAAELKMIGTGRARTIRKWETLDAVVPGPVETAVEFMLKEKGL